jgi:LAO/AO transport system kinase
MDYNNADFLTEKILSGDKRALSRAITLVENEDPRAVKIERDLYGNTGKAYRVGITGPPGAGKSTLVNVLAREFKSRGNRIGIIAIDPTSPFTGGALLGDRIRMGAALADPDIFMRSMASRGGTGGLARTTTQVADVMDAFGFDVLIIETVGVGQLELDIAGSVDTTVVVLVPEAGGGIQAMKAGLIEIADIFAINKADRDGAEILKSELQDALSLMPAIKNSSWDLPVKLTVALEGKGVKELVDTVYAHKDHLEQTGKFHINRQSQAEIKIKDIVRAEVAKRLWMNPELSTMMDSLSRFCVEGKIDPYTAARSFLRSAEVQKV